jgi:hypothetical protein
MMVLAGDSDRSLPGMRVSPILHPAVSSATKAVAASSAILPPVTAQTVASERGVGGGVSR